MSWISRIVEMCSVHLASTIDKKSAWYWKWTRVNSKGGGGQVFLYLFMICQNIFKKLWELCSDLFISYCHVFFKVVHFYTRRTVDTPLEGRLYPLKYFSTFIHKPYFRNKILELLITKYIESWHFQMWSFFIVLKSPLWFRFEQCWFS